MCAEAAHARGVPEAQGGSARGVRLVCSALSACAWYMLSVVSGDVHGLTDRGP